MAATLGEEVEILGAGELNLEGFVSFDIGWLEGGEEDERRR
jgi:hypothetical protein